MAAAGVRVRAGPLPNLTLLCFPRLYPHLPVLPLRVPCMELGGMRQACLNMSRLRRFRRNSAHQPAPATVSGHIHHKQQKQFGRECFSPMHAMMAIAHSYEHLRSAAKGSLQVLNRQRS